MRFVFVVDPHLAFEDEVDGVAHNCCLYHRLILTCVLIRKRSTEHGYKLSVSFVAEFRVLEQDVKLFLERLKELALHDFDFHVLADLLVEITLPQECVGAMLEVLKSVVPPLLDDLPRNFSVDGKLTTNFNDQIFGNFHHLVGVFSGRDLVADHKALDFLNCHGVEEHTDELQEEDA